MPTIFRKYGPITEITELEKEPSKIRLSSARERRDVYGPRRHDNIRRTRQICVRRLLSALEEFGPPLLLTLTFKGDASDAAYASDALRRFQARLRTEFDDPQSLFVPELSPRSRIHFHGLLFNVPQSLGDKKEGRRIVSYGEERSTRVLAGLWGEGFVDATQTDGSRRLAYYISKYITKEGGETLFNAMRMLRISNGFPREIIIRGSMAEELARRAVSKKKLKRQWEMNSMFFGKISRKIYED